MPAKKKTRPVVTKGEEDVFYELELKGQKSTRLSPSFNETKAITPPP